MKPGPKPEPLELKIAKGNPGNRPLPEAPTLEDAPPSPLDPPPGLNTAAQAIWHQIAPTLIRTHVVRATDRAALGRYCQLADMALRLMAKAEAADLIYETQSKHGAMLRTHPALLSLLKVVKVLEATEDRFGLNPSSRFSLRARQLQAGLQAELPLDDHSPIKKGILN